MWCRPTAERFLLCILSLLKLSYAAVYTDVWALEIDGGQEEARTIARRNGFVYVDQIMPGFYQFQHRKVAKRSIHQSWHHHENLAKEPQVKWLQQQVVRKRVKRDLLFFTDPRWKHMWYLNRESGGNMNVEKAWKKNYTGKNIVVSILDDGIEKDHPDLRRNYDSEASFDVNDNDPDPQPRYDYSNENRHGTRCAGEVAAEANNNICSLGVAFDAKIGGIRMLDGDVTDSVEARSLSHHPQHIQIYSASWGPDDDGRTVDGPAYMASRAFSTGVQTGRGGLGSIFVWASGNGGRDGDSCNCDGYTNSIYTLSISSATEHGNIPWYSEACSSTLATTYSSGSGGEKQIITTDLRKACTESHTGTSASAPLAAGICALALEANPKLTWRDMQHIVVRTANPKGLQAGDWVTNAVGRKVSHSFGYGVLDASAMVDLALNWTTVPPQHACTIRAEDTNKVVPINSKITLKLRTNGCRGSINQVLFLEHVQARISLTSNHRGEIEIYLTSPMGTRSTLLARRVRDMSKDGFNDWAFMTTHSWGELANGTWLLEISNGDSAFRTAKLREWRLVLYGTAVHPSTPPPVSTTPVPTVKPTTAHTYKNKNKPPPKDSVIKVHYNCSSQHKSGTPKMMNEVRGGPIATANPRHMPVTTEGELKTWSLILHGTERDPQKSGKKHPNISSSASTPATMSFLPHDIHCLYARIDGSCIACKPGYALLTQSCNKGCPNDMAEYRDYMQLVNGTRLVVSTCKLKLAAKFIDMGIVEIYVLAVTLCLSCVLFFVILFLIFQARDRQLLCFRQQLQKLDLDEEFFEKGKKYSALISESDSEEELTADGTHALLHKQSSPIRNGTHQYTRLQTEELSPSSLVSIPLDDSSQTSHNQDSVLFQGVAEERRQLLISDSED